jgi:hypothetical protein
MLVLENVAMFEAIYDATKKIYPIISDTIIVVGYADIRAGVQLLEGTEDDTGKYKIAVAPSDDNQILASFFMGGLAMLIYKLKYDKYVHPVSQDTEFKPDDNYKEILDNIIKAFEHVPYGGEYAHE